MDIDYQLLDAIQASIYWKDLNGVYRGCNKYMVKVMGLKSRDQIIGKTDDQFPWKKHATKIREIDQLVIKNNKNYEIEEHPRIWNGITKTILSSKFPFHSSNNQIIGIIGVSVDIIEEVKHPSSKNSYSMKLIKNTTEKTHELLLLAVNAKYIFIEELNNLQEIQIDVSNQILKNFKYIINLIIDAWRLLVIAFENSPLKLETKDIILLIVLFFVQYLIF